MDETSSGTLKTKISLGQKYPQIVNMSHDPFYLLREPPEKNIQTASTNLLAKYGLESTYNKLCTKKIKEEISAFLPTIPGIIDGPATIPNSSLKSVIEKPPICGKLIVPLNSNQLAGFRLHSNGPLPQKYLMQDSTSSRKHKKKDKRHKYDDNGQSTSEKKHKKGKKHDESGKKKKKSKKQRKQNSDDMSH